MRNTPAVVVTMAAVVYAGIAAAQTRPKPPFTFTEVDRKLLAECEAVDRLFEQRGLVLHDPAIDAQIGEMAARLVPSDPLESVVWRFRVLREPMVNAFALPNGSIYLNSGLLARAENDDQVAAVLAHEVAHVTNRHGFIFNRALRKRIATLNAISAVAGWLPVGGALGRTVWAAASVSQFAIIVSVYGYSQDLEEEADASALERLNAVRRDGRQLARIFALLHEKIEPEPDPIFFRTHPKARKRIETVNAKLGVNGDAAPALDRAFLERMRPALLQNLQLDLDSRRFRSAVAGAARLADARPDDAESICALAEALRALGPRKPRLTPKELTFFSHRRVYADEHNRTEEDQAKRLASTSDGREALETNYAKAKELFEKAIALDSSLARPHLGLGMLYQDQGKRAEALAEYERYLQLAPETSDRLRVQRRIELLRAAGQSK